MCTNIISTSFLSGDSPRTYEHFVHNAEIRDWLRLSYLVVTRLHSYVFACFFEPMKAVPAEVQVRRDLNNIPSKS
jgi:hypothetical protein